MGYATAADIQQRLGTTVCVQLTDDENSGTANMALLEEALHAADGEINSRLSCRYAVPVDVSSEAETAALLKALVLDLAVQRLHARRPPIPAAVTEAAVNARQWLRDLVHGRVHLPVERQLAENQARGIVAGASGPARVFSRD